jgi:hypothetical protein
MYVVPQSYFDSSLGRCFPGFVPEFRGPDREHPGPFVAVSPVTQTVTAIGTDTRRRRATLLESYVVLVLDLTVGGAYGSPILFWL